MAKARRDIDRDQVKMLVLQLGVRAAARELDIPEGTVQTWSADGNWLADTRPTVIPAKLPPPISQAPITSTNSTKPVDALKNRLNRDSKTTRLALSTATKKAATKFARKDGDAIIDQAQELRHVAAVASQIHGWEGGKGGGGLTLNLGVAIGAMR